MLGSDFAGTDSIDWAMTFREGEEQEQIAAQESVGRRYLQGSGTLFYDESYGLDLRTFLVDVIPPAVAKGMIIAEALKDERVLDCRVEITEDPITAAWTIEISPVLSDGTSFTRTFVLTSEGITTLTES